MTAADLRSAIVLVDFDPARGHQQAGSRRALVVSCEALTGSGWQLCARSRRGTVQHVSSPSIRQQVRSAVSHQLGLDLPAPTDGAA